MIRIVIENILLFLVPTFLYLAYALLTRGTAARGGNAAPGAIVFDDAPLMWLFLAGALIVGATLIYYATVTPGGAPGLSYTPPHMGKDGRVEPGVLKQR